MSKILDTLLADMRLVTIIVVFLRKSYGHTTNHAGIDPGMSQISCK
jgi:hypothetical protein